MGEAYQSAMVNGPVITHTWVVTPALARWRLAGARAHPFELWSVQRRG